VIFFFSIAFYVIRWFSASAADEMIWARLVPF
jgi:hypothetical protein